MPDACLHLLLKTPAVATEHCAAQYRAGLVDVRCPVDQGIIVVRCGAVRCGAGCCSAVRRGVVWFGVLWCGLVWCGEVW